MLIVDVEGKIVAFIEFRSKNFAILIAFWKIILKGKEPVHILC